MQPRKNIISIAHNFVENEKQGLQQSLQNRAMEISLNTTSAKSNIEEILRHMKVNNHPSWDQSKNLPEEFNSFSEFENKNKNLSSTEEQNQEFFKKFTNEITKQIIDNYDILQKIPNSQRKEDIPSTRLSFQNDKSMRIDAKRHFEHLRDYILNGTILTDTDITEDTELLRIALSLKSEYNRLMDKNYKLEKALEKTLKSQSLGVGNLVKDNKEIKSLLKEQEIEEGFLITKNTHFLQKVKTSDTKHEKEITNRSKIEQLLKYTDRQIDIISKNNS